MKKRIIFFALIIIPFYRLFANDNNMSFCQLQKNDTVRNYPRFEIYKPNIGFDIGGPSCILALHYQQPFAKLSSKNVLALDMLYNNNNLLLESYYIYDPEQLYNLKNHGTYKFASYLTWQHFFTRWLFTEISTGGIYYQYWIFSFNTHWSGKHFKDINEFYPNIRASLGIKPLRNFTVKYTLNKLLKEDYEDLFCMTIGESKFAGSLSLLFSFNKKSNDTLKRINFWKHQLSFSLPKNQLCYEYVFLNNRLYNFSALFASSFIPFKRFGVYSYKLGFYSVSDIALLLNYSLGKYVYSFAGMGVYSNLVNYTVLNDRFNQFSYGYRSQVGFSFLLSNHLRLKLYYSPYIYKKVNINIENMDHFAFQRFYKLNIGLAYAW